MVKTPHCTYCDEIGHYQSQCFKKAKTLQRIDYSKRNSKRALRVAGKFGRKWNRKRASWKRQNPPNHQGYYTCYLCGKYVEGSEMQLDHIIPRSRAPELRFEMSNLAPSCPKCNRKKGSKVYAET